MSGVWCRVWCRVVLSLCVVSCGVVFGRVEAYRAVFGCVWLCVWCIGVCVERRAVAVSSPRAACRAVSSLVWRRVLVYIDPEWKQLRLFGI